MRCSEKDILFRGSNVPCIRILKQEDGWVVSPEQNRGLHVYINSPACIVFSKLRAVRITDVSDKTALAEVTCV